MEITYDKLKVNWDTNSSFVLHYINSKNDIMFSKEDLWVAIMKQAMYIVRHSDSDYWYLAANYDLLFDVFKDIVNTKTSISTPFISFVNLQSLIRESEGCYTGISTPLDIAVVMDMLLSSYNTQITMLRKAEQYG